MRFPTISDVANRLREVNAIMPAGGYGGVEEGADVRLQVLPDGDWVVWDGDAKYDTDHRGYWGASSIPGGGARFSASEVAKELIAQCREAKAQSPAFNLKSVRADLAAVGLKITKSRETGEYRVAFPGRNSEASAYYTNDLSDALGTGKAMAARGDVAAMDTTEKKRPPKAFDVGDAVISKWHKVNGIIKKIEWSVTFGNWSCLVEGVSHPAGIWVVQSDLRLATAPDKLEDSEKVRATLFAQRGATRTADLDRTLAGVQRADATRERAARQARRDIPAEIVKPGPGLVAALAQVRRKPYSISLTPEEVRALRYVTDRGYGEKILRVLSHAGVGPEGDDLDVGGTVYLTEPDAWAMQQAWERMNSDTGGWGFPSISDDLNHKFVRLFEAVV